MRSAEYVKPRRALPAGDPLRTPRSAFRIEMVRLQKFLADPGVASRRAGEQMILAGRVGVNGKIVGVLGTRVVPVHDAVAVDGKPVRAKRKIYVALNKPPGVVCGAPPRQGGGGGERKAGPGEAQDLRGAEQAAGVGLLAEG